MSSILDDIIKVNSNISISVKDGDIEFSINGSSAAILAAMCYCVDSDDDFRDMVKHTSDYIKECEEGS